MTGVKPKRLAGGQSFEAADRLHSAAIHLLRRLRVRDRRRAAGASRSERQGHEDPAGGTQAPGGIACESALVTIRGRAAETGNAYGPPPAGHSESLKIFDE